MADLFDQFDVPVNDVNPTPPAATGITASGAPAYKPNGKINDMEIAKDLDSMKAAPAATASKNPPPLPSAPNAEGQQGALQTPTDATPEAQQGQEPPHPDLEKAIQFKFGTQAPQSGDLFDKLQIDAPRPTVQQINGNALSAAANVTTPAPHHQEAADYVNGQKSQDEILAQNFFSPDQIEGFKNNPITLTEAHKFLDSNQVLPGGGVYRGIDAYNLIKIGDKLKAGASMNDLSVGEQTTLYSYAQKQIEMNLRGFTWGGKMFYVGSQLPAFVTEFVASGGIGKAAQEATLQAGSKYAINATLKATAGYAANAAARSATFLLPDVIGNYGDIRLANNMTVTDKGYLVSKQSEQSPAMSALQAYGYTTADALSQEIAPLIAAPVKAAFGKIATPIVSAANKYIAPEVKQALYEAWSKMTINPRISQMFSTLGWKGALEQLGANRVDQVMKDTIQYATNKNYSADDWWNNLTPGKQDLAVEMGLVGIAGAVSASTHLAANIIESRGAAPAEAMDKAKSMTEKERDAFVERNVQQPKSNFPPLYEDEKAPVKTGKESPVELQSMLASKASNRTIIDSQLQAFEKANPPPINEEASVFNRHLESFKDTWHKEIYPALLNDLQPIQDLSDTAAKQAKIPPGTDPALLARRAREISGLIRYNLEVNTAHFSEDGNLHDTGKSLKSIRDDFDNYFMDMEPDLEQRHNDLNDFRIAKRYMHENSLGKQGGFVSEKQLETSKNKMAELSDKYGKEFPMFDTFAKEEVGFTNRILYNLVTSGLKDENWYKQTVARNPWYVPLNRIVEEEGWTPSIGRKNLGKDPNANNIGSMKRFKGSELEEKNVMLSTMKNTALILQKSAVNKMLLNVARYSNFYPEDVKIEEPKMIQKPINMVYDPKLRAKLKMASDALGVKTERSKNFSGRRLGAYYPAQELIKLRGGSGEGVYTHELGHALDFKLGLKEKLLSDPVIKKQLIELSHDRELGKILMETNPEGYQHFVEVKREMGDPFYRQYIENDDEILANMYDAYVNSPEQLKEVAPKALKAFEKIIDSHKELAFLKDIKPSTNRADEQIQAIKRQYDPEKGQMPFYTQGMRKFLRVSPEIELALKGLTESQKTILDRWFMAPLTKSKDLVQWGATTPLNFLLRHFIRGNHMAYLNTEGRVTPVGVAKSMFQIIGDTAEYRKYRASTGTFDYFPIEDKNLAASYKAMFDDKKLLNPLDWYRKLRVLSDASPRFAAFQKYKAEGMSDIEAGMQALQATADFGRHGSFSAKVNKIDAFFNDTLQGTLRMAEAFKKNPVGFTARAFATITVPQLILTGYYLYGADDQTRKEYLELPQWRKSIGFNFKVGDHWLFVPRPFLPGFAFGAIPEQVMMHYYNGYKPEAKNFWQNMLMGAVNSAAPVVDVSRALPSLFKMAIENITNYNFFLDRPITPQYMDDLPPEFRSKLHTSETAKAIGNLFGVSPAKIDNTVYDMAAGMGNFMTQVSDKGIELARKMEGKTVAAKPEDLANYPVASGFVNHNPTGEGGASTQEFFDNFEKSSQMHNASKKLAGQDQADYLQKNQKDLGQYSQLEQTHKEIAGLLHQQRNIYNDEHMDSDEKARQLKVLDNQITDIAIRSNIQYNKATGQGD